MFHIETEEGKSGVLVGGEINLARRCLRELGVPFHQILAQKAVAAATVIDSDVLATHSIHPEATIVVLMPKVQTPFIPSIVPLVVQEPNPTYRAIAL